MPQILRTKHFGEVRFEKTFLNGNLHIGRLVGGGYCHVTGHPITIKKDGINAITTQADREDFVRWWEQKDQPPVEEVQRLIVVQPDGSYAFDDGEPITSAEEIIQYCAPGLAQEQILRWFAGELVRREKEAKKAGETIIGQIRQDAAGAVGKKGKPLHVKDAGKAAEEVAIRE